ncbi:BQ2448_1729 [Microbotryum intermedium]|uniref:BQ2448_1729 protein n=1 Tax=Microbotryum intermedium TaxID=269621 RepID=A0A238FAV2_9BASI|nr:BQ2448_1729 [Microbotryum intermedium]
MAASKQDASMRAVAAHHGDNDEPELPSLPSTSTVELPRFNISTYDFSPLVSSPSPLSLNHAGQILLLTRGQINILVRPSVLPSQQPPSSAGPDELTSFLPYTQTPATGYQTDRPIVQSGALANLTADANTSKGKERASVDDPTPLPAFRTTIPVEKKDLIDWGGWANEIHVGTAASGSLEHFWRDAAWSPLGFGSIGGCALVALSNNSEAIVYEPQKNAHKSQWVATYDITSHLVRLLLRDEDPTTPAANKPVETQEDRRMLATRIWECQSTAVAWSSAVPGVYGDFSILAIGHKSGHVSLWRRSHNGNMSILHRYRLDPQASWITLMSWSEWILSDDATTTTSLLSATDSTGRVWVIEISQNLTAGRPLLSDDEAAAPEMSEDVWATEPIVVCEPDQRLVSQFKWIPNDESLSTLAYTKLGTVTFVDLGPNTSEDPMSTYQLESLFEIELNTQGDWMGTTPWAPCCGIEWYAASKALVLALESSAFYFFGKSDGQWHFIDSSETVKDESMITTSAQATQIARQVFLRTFRQTYATRVKRQETQSAGGTWKKGARILGLAGFGEDGQLGWLFENVSPDLMNYKAIGHTRTQFVVLPILGNVKGDRQRARLETILAAPFNALETSPLAVLRSFLRYADENLSNSPWTFSILNLLESDPTTIEAPTVSSITDRESTALTIFENLYVDAPLNNLRYRELVARFLARHASLPKGLKRKTVEVQQSLARKIVHQVMTRLGDMMSAAQEHLTPAELTISGRILLASASFTDAETKREDEEEEETLPLPDTLLHTFGGSEHCPACSSPIALKSVRSAACERGHVWERCSITLQVVDTVVVRTCVGCERKAFLGLKKGKEGVQEGWVGSSPNQESGIVETMLRECKACLYCGCSWMMIR